MRHPTVLAASILATLVWLSRPCMAMDPEEIYQAAVADMKAGRYADACPRFAEARRVRPDSTPALQGLALCFDKAGMTASAWARYRELSVEMKAHGDKERGEAAAVRAEELSKVLSTVVVTLDSPDTQGLILRLDHEDVPRVMFNTTMKVDPGRHVIEATAPGYEVWQTTLIVGERNDAKQVRIPALQAIKATPAVPAAGPTATAPALAPGARSSGWSGQRIGGVAMAGAGLVSVIVGSVFGAQAMSNMSASKQTCKGASPSDICSTQAGLTARQNAGTDATISTATFVVGGALLAGGAIVFFTAPSGVAKAPPSAGAVRLRIASMGATGAVVRAEGAW